MKGGDRTINEYILTIKTKPSKIFCVQAHNEFMAKVKFIEVCKQFMKTDNDGHQDHWSILKKAIESNKYSIIQNYDYCGVREII